MPTPLLAFLNDAFVPYSELRLGVGDLAIQRGYGIFDFFKVLGGRPLFLDRYLDRFETSANLMRLPLPYSRTELRGIIRELLERNGRPDTGVKLVLTGGASADGYKPGPPSFFISQHPLAFPPARDYEQGIRIITHEYQRDLPTVKSINYLMGVWLQPKVEAAGASDVLYHREGVITEFPRCNLFVVRRDGAVVTPADNVLGGVTRGNVLRLAANRGPAAATRVTLEDLRDAAEVFLTSTSKRVLPIVQVDNQIVGNGKPGPVTRALLADLLELERLEPALT